VEDGREVRKGLSGGAFVVPRRSSSLNAPQDELLGICEGVQLSKKSQKDLEVSN